MVERFTLLDAAKVSHGSVLGWLERELGSNTKLAKLSEEEHEWPKEELAQVGVQVALGPLKYGRNSKV
jgi:hypothetical protein